MFSWLCCGRSRSVGDGTASAERKISALRRRGLTSGAAGEKDGLRMKYASLSALTAAAVFLFASAEAAAQLRSDWGVNKAQHQDWDGGYDLRAERRSGFAAGIQVGYGVSSASGYPNEVEKLDRSEYRSSTGLSFGSANTIWLGGALRDWFVFGLGIWGVSAKKGDIEALGSGFMLHVEAFPLFALGGRFRDLSVYTNVGPGALKIEGGPEDADGGLMSMLNLGVSFEVLRLKFFALGPTLDGMYTYSQYANGGGAFLGVKGVIYGGP